MYVIYVETVTGEQIRAFTWTRDRESGVARARIEAKLNNIPVARVYAKEINTRHVAAE